jgi:hypothetical protein
MQPEHLVFNIERYLSNFAHLFTPDTTAFLEELDNIVYNNKFELVTSEMLARALSLYREGNKLSFTVMAHPKIANAEPKSSLLPSMIFKLDLFADRYIDATLASMLMGGQVPEDIRTTLHEMVVCRQKEKRLETMLEFAGILFDDFSDHCQFETEVRLFLLRRPPTLGCPDNNTVSLQWPEFALDKCGSQYVVSEKKSKAYPYSVIEFEFYEKKV